jgi:hypothetical protein
VRVHAELPACWECDSWLALPHASGPSAAMSSLLSPNFGGDP